MTAGSLSSGSANFTNAILLYLDSDNMADTILKYIISKGEGSSSK
jgi:hypothetical protein